MIRFENKRAYDSMVLQKIDILADCFNLKNKTFSKSFKITHHEYLSCLG